MLNGRGGFSPKPIGSSLLLYAPSRALGSAPPEIMELGLHRLHSAKGLG